MRLMIMSINCLAICVTMYQEETGTVKEAPTKIVFSIVTLLTWISIVFVKFPPKGKPFSFSFSGRKLITLACWAL